MRKIIWIGGAAVVLAVAVIGSGGATALAESLSGSAIVQDTDDGPDAPLTGSAMERATQAALAHTGGGTVTDTESGDDGAAYGVEIRTPDGRQVEVNVDADFVVIGEESDDD